MNFKSKVKAFARDKSGVFGLTSVQAFFAIILAVALLAYVIVIIMGTLQASTIIPLASSSTTNESIFINSTGDALNFASTYPGFSGTITSVNVNALVVPSANYTLVGNTIYNATAATYANANISYSFTYTSTAAVQSNSILGNTSTGITAFFAAINPVYAILAILVIILVLVVLVRVVTGGTGTQRESSVPL